MAILKAFEFVFSAGSAALQPALIALVSPFLLGEMNDRLRWCGISVGFASLGFFGILFTSFGFQLMSLLERRASQRQSI